MFALASWLAFQHELWSEAVRFADFAAQAAEKDLNDGNEAHADGSDLDDAETVYYECQYLKALALRIRMASEEPSEAYDADVWRRDLNAAEQALDLCIEHHRAREKVRLLRALSERAAVRLTYCAWAAVGRLALLQPNQREWLDLSDTMRGAVSVTSRKWQNPFHARTNVDRTTEGFDRDTRSEALDWAEFQAAINPECARILYERLRELEDPNWEKSYLPLMQGVERELASIDAIQLHSYYPQFEPCDLQSLCPLEKRQTPAPRRCRLDDAARRSSISLALDRAMFPVVEDGVLRIDALG